MNANDTALAGLKVIDCATYVAGPAAATILSDFGADVIKIERPPDGDLWRTFSSVAGYPNSEFSYTWLLTSRNKRSIVLDLTKSAGRDALLRLVSGADVFVTNFQLSLLKKFRSTWEDLARSISASSTRKSRVTASAATMRMRRRTMDLPIGRAPV